MGSVFLTDDSQSQWIADQVEPLPQDIIVEVGPGTGALTDQLIDRAGRLVLIEFDRKLAGALQERFAANDAVTVFHEDAVKFDVRPLFADGPVKFIGNLPYSSGTEIIRNFFSSPSPVEQAIVMLQHEVAERICAEPGAKAFGNLSLQIQAALGTTHPEDNRTRGFYAPAAGRLDRHRTQTTRA